MNSIEIYLHLRKEIESFCMHLNSLHSEYLTCSPECDACCVNFTVYPVEVMALKQAAAEKKLSLNTVTWHENAACGFLHKKKCQIYEIRPLICMTHGLPVMLTDENNNEKSVSYCPLNFADKQPDFNESNCIPLDQINNKLYLINRRFLEEQSLDTRPDHRIELKDVLL